MSCFYDLTFTMVPQWENKCPNKTHSTKHSSYSKSIFIHFTHLDKFWLETHWNLTDRLTCYVEHPALGKLCIWTSHWHTSNGNWFLKKYDQVAFQWSSISLSDWCQSLRKVSDWHSAILATHFWPEISNHSKGYYFSIYLKNVPVTLPCPLTELTLLL